MPGPVSDSYDPEFGTGANAADVGAAIRELSERLSKSVLRGKPVRYIVQVVHGLNGPDTAAKLSEKEWRIIRFCLNRALETM